MQYLRIKPPKYSQKTKKILSKWIKKYDLSKSSIDKHFFFFNKSLA